uniref:HTH_Tnp_Tc3_2 domain-containing protein n=1 Tax=Heterorhabditis bacteriophora TaxID=37862 RepID=A0A1I7WRT0_HETBA
MLPLQTNTCTAKHHPRSGIAKSLITSHVRRIVNKRILREDKRTTTKIASDLNINPTSVKRIVKHELRFYPRKIRPVHYANHYSKARKLLSIITQSLTLNVHSQHDMRWSETVGNFFDVDTRSHFPSSVMIWAGITASGKTPLVSVEENVRINAKYYQAEILLKVVISWLSKHFGSRNWTFQQNWTPAHGVKTTVELCRQQSPDLCMPILCLHNSPADSQPMSHKRRTARTHSITSLGGSELGVSSEPKKDASTSLNIMHMENGQPPPSRSAHSRPTFDKLERSKSRSSMIEKDRSTQLTNFAMPTQKSNLCTIL